LTNFSTAFITWAMSHDRSILVYCEYHHA
jgi:hypothetical protein